MHTKYTRCIRDGGPERFEVWPVHACIHRLVYNAGSAVIHLKDLHVPAGISVEEGGFVVQSHRHRDLRYITPKQAKRYVSPSKR